MGQILGSIQSKFEGKDWRDRQLRKITDKVFDHFQDDTGKVNMTFRDLYIAVLLVYNDINKHLPGTHVDPPSKAQIRGLVEKYDINYDGELNRDEFAGVLKKLTADTFTVVSQRLIISLIAAPTVALLTKRATEGVPGVGKVVQKLPRSVYASLFTLAVVLIQKSQDR
ncbi:hypothetical protein Syun_018002 [Stephania yunnanensis]|uniref:EF-hand domain-containing protein n=1 Tax=Stephania yunnanensis TaxID=152371 RepID=A0AAP0NWM2_9MAGN